MKKKNRIYWIMGAEYKLQQYLYAVCCKFNVPPSCKNAVLEALLTAYKAISHIITNMKSVSNILLSGEHLYIVLTLSINIIPAIL